MHMALAYGVTMTTSNTLSFSITGTFDSAYIAATMRRLSGAIDRTAASFRNIRCVCGERSNPHWEHTVLDGCTWKG